MVDVRRTDGTTVKRRVSYWVSPNRNGASRDSAVRIVADNMIAGDLAEKHMLRTKFPTWRPLWKEDDSVDFKTLLHTYHVYWIPMPGGTTRQFWFDANDYHGFF